jgi:hypothetical protein
LVNANEWASERGYNPDTVLTFIRRKVKGMNEDKLLQFGYYKDNCNRVYIEDNDYSDEDGKSELLKLIEKKYPQRYNSDYYCDVLIGKFNLEEKNYKLLYNKICFIVRQNKELKAKINELEKKLHELEK